MGLISRIRGRKTALTNQADKLNVFGVPIKTADWMPKTQAMFISGDDVVLLKGLPHPNPIIRLAQRCVYKLKRLFRGIS